MDAEGRINAYLNVCRPAPHGYVGPSHWHREPDGQMRPYISLICDSYCRCKPMEVNLADLLKRDR